MAMPGRERWKQLNPLLDELLDLEAVRGRRRDQALAHVAAGPCGRGALRARHPRRAGASADRHHDAGPRAGGLHTLIGGIGLVLLSLALEPVEASHLRALATWPTLPALAFLVVAGSRAGLTIYTKLLRDWGAFRAGLDAFIGPVIAVGVGVVALSERFGWAEGVGALLMFAAAAIALHRSPAT